MVNNRWETLRLLAANQKATRWWALQSFTKNKVKILEAPSALTTYSNTHLGI